MWSDDGSLVVLLYLGLGVLVALLLLVMGVFVSAIRQLKRSDAYEVIEIEPKGQTPEGQVITRQRRVRRIDTSAPWDGEPRPVSGVTFPESWRYEWPDPPPEPSRLPDEEPRP